jgi:hypothetical protein
VPDPITPKTITRHQQIRDGGSVQVTNPRATDTTNWGD